MAKTRFECCINCEKRFEEREGSCHDGCVKYIAVCLANSEEIEERAEEARIKHLLHKAHKPKKKNEWKIKPKRRV